MLALLRYISIRHLILSPLRTALTIIGVSVGVATLVGITAINRSVMASFRSTIDTIAGKADLTIATGQTGFEEELLEQVRAVPGIAHAAGMLSAVAPVQGSPGESMYVMGVDLLDDGYFRTYESPDRNMGALADDLEFLNSTDRMMVSERFAAAHGLKAGSTFELLTQDGVKPFIVHGLLRETGPIKAFGGSVGIMFFASAQEAFGRGRKLDHIDVKLAPGADPEAVKKALRALAGPGVEIDRPDRRGQSVESMVRSFQLGLNLGSGVALLVGAFLVYNTVAIGVIQRRREIGTLRALGTTRRRIRTLFALEAAVMGIIGSIFGLPLGIVIGRGAISYVSASVSAIYVKVNVGDVRVTATELTVGVLVGVLGSVFAALRPAFVASSVQPVEALRRDVAMGAGAVELRAWPTYLGAALLVAAWAVTYIPPPVENFPIGGYISMFAILMGVTLLSPLLLRFLNRPWRGPSEALMGVPGRLAADNFSRAPVRTAVPVSALAIGVAMTVCVGSFTGSFQKSGEKWIDQAIPADLFVTSSARVSGVQNQPMSPGLGDELKALPDVANINPIRLFPHDVLGLRVFIISLNPDTYNERARPIVLDGTLPTSEESKAGLVTVSENFARRRGLKAGSTFPVDTPTGTVTYKIAAVIIDYTSDQGALFIDRNVFNRQFKDDRVDTFHVFLKDIKTLEATRKTITEKYGAKFNLYVLSNAELRQEAMSIIDNAFSATYAMELVAMILALLGVINTLLAAVLDRTREIGLVRAIGASRRHVIKLFVAEAALIGLTGGAIGVSVGAVLGLIMTRVVGVQSTGWNFPFLFPWGTAVQMLLAATLCAIVAGLYPARRAARIDVVEALAWE